MIIPNPIGTSKRGSQSFLIATVMNAIALQSELRKIGVDCRVQSAIDMEKFPKLSGVVDAVYNPINSYLVCTAKEKGIPACGGLYMLVSQAVRACEHFTGRFSRFLSVPSGDGMHQSVT